MFSSDKNAADITHIEQKDKTKDLQKAKEAALNLKTNVFHLDLSPEELRGARGKEEVDFDLPSNKKKSLRFFTLGCQGNAEDAQKKVAALMAEIAKQPNKKPDFVLFLGDNFYDRGVDSADHADFIKYFDEMYAGLGPHFLIQGNHDQNLSGMSGPFAKGKERGFHQIIHSFMADEKYSTDEKLHLYEKGRFRPSQLPLYNMPKDHFSIDSGKIGDTEILCLDSNSIASDYLEYLDKGSATPPENQILYIKDRLSNSAAKTKIAAQHHPLKTPGRRATGKDLKYYVRDEKQRKALKQFFLKEKINLIHRGLTIDEVEEISKAILENKAKQIKIVSQQEIQTLEKYTKSLDCYNTVLYEIYKREGFVFDTILTAHDHDVYYFNNTKTKNNAEDYYPLCQLTSGGGGGGLQKWSNFNDREMLGCFIQHHGFTEVECDGDRILYHIYALNAHQEKQNYKTYSNSPSHGYHLVFDNQSNEAIREYPKDMPASERDEIKDFCSVIKEALNEYFSQGNAHGNKGKSRVQDIWTYINNYEVADFKTTVAAVSEMAHWMRFKKPTAKSFITIVDKAIAANYNGRTLAELNISINPVIKVSKEKHPHEKIEMQDLSHEDIHLSPKALNKGMVEEKKKKKFFQFFSKEETKPKIEMDSFENKKDFEDKQEKVEKFDVKNAVDLLTIKPDKHKKKSKLKFWSNVKTNNKKVEMDDLKKEKSPKL